MVHYRSCLGVSLLSCINLERALPPPALIPDWDHSDFSPPKNFGKEAIRPIMGLRDQRVALQWVYRSCLGVSLLSCINLERALPPPALIPETVMLSGCYRLGPFGFLTSEELRQRGYKANNGAPRSACCSTPALIPETVMLSGFPPKSAMCRATHCRATR
jgi:hypothetical protein